MRNTKRTKTKTYFSTLLVESYREDGKNKHRTILNLSKWKPEHINALEMALKAKCPVDLESLEMENGKSYGAIHALKRVADSLGIVKALGSGKKGKLALFLIIARIITQGSRLSAVQWAQGCETEEILGLDRFDEDDLYESLDWLCENQERIEKELYERREKPDRIFLYDITSSYLEGNQNELAAYGYNRDGKKGKKQVVIGLLTDGDGTPISVDLFDGNTSDNSTVSNQIVKMAARFGVGKVTMVGDKGMLKNCQIADLSEWGLSYITSITKNQIRTLIKEGSFQLELFDEKLTEIEEDGVRYLLRKNRQRAKESADTRMEKVTKIEERVTYWNIKLANSRSKVETALKDIESWIEKLKSGKWLDVKASGRRLEIIRDEDALKEVAHLDGCYVIKTDLPKEEASAEEVHSRYKDLAHVEHAFRTIKTGHLEIRPIFVRKASRTRGHVFVTTLAYMIIKEFWSRTSDLGLSLENMIDQLDKLSSTYLILPDKSKRKVAPTPNKSQRNIISKLGIRPLTAF